MRRVYNPFIRRKIRVGLDFDGVVAYNPFRVIRPVVAFVKTKLFGVRRLEFFYPRKRWQQILWIIAHESSIFPAYGIYLLRRMVKEETIEVHLITARFSFLDDHLNRWLVRNKLKHIFRSVNLNKQDAQPHIFKEKTVSRLKLDYFIEDNLDIVKYLSQRSGTKIFWIYNLFDRYTSYKYKYPYLKKALQDIK